MKRFLLLILFCGSLQAQDTTGMLSSTFFTWSNNDWQNWLFLEYTYNADATAQNILYKQWSNNTQAWVNWNYNAYTYGETGLRITETYQDWNASQAAFVNFSRRLHTYDDTGHMTESLYQRWINGQWTNSGLTYITYDDQYNQITSTTYLWQTGNWIPSTRRLATFENQLETIVINQSFSNGNWESQNQSTHSYLPDGRRNQTLYQTGSAGSLTDNTIAQHHYDANGYYSGRTEQTWNTAQSQWQNSKDFNYSNNANGTLDVNINKIWSENTAQWQNYQKATYVYSTLSHAQFQTEILTLYPNPASDFVFIDGLDNTGATVDVFDFQGKRLKSVMTDGGMDLSDLASGAYQLVIRQNGKMQVAKVLKH